LKRGGGECDNVNFTNFKIDSFKICKKIVNFFAVLKFVWSNLEQEHSYRIELVEKNCEVTQ